jgi:hypothetical protein
MGRKSKLTDQQWLDIERRLNNGEKQSDLAKEFGVDRSLINKRFSQQVEKIETLAKQVLTTECEIKQLNLFQQSLLVEKVNHLRMRDSFLEQGAHHSAFVFNKLSLAARHKAEKLNLDAEVIDEDEISSLMKLGMTANTFAKSPIEMKKSERETKDSTEKTIIEVVHSPTVARV